MSEKFGERNIFQNTEPKNEAGSDQAKKEQQHEEVKHPELVERELSPEVIEKIMEKVQDIDANGTAYHLLSISSAVSQSEGRNEKLSEVLKHGLLGTYWEDAAEDKDPANANIQNWVSKLKERRNRGAVWFDVIGRGDENYERRNFERFYQDYNRRQLPRIAGSFWWSLPGREKLFATAVIIDISAMKEASHILDFHEDMTTPTENREYRIHGSPNDDEKRRNVLAKNGIDLANPGAYELAKNKGLGHYLPKTNPADGFVTNTRIRSKQITGVVFKAMEPAHEDEAGKEGRGLRMVLDQKELHEKANGVIEQVRKVYEGREADAPPIYDMLGNLHWPKQMSYEEVQKFVAEREDKKSRPEQKD